MTRMSFKSFTTRAPSGKALEDWPMYVEWLLGDWPRVAQSLTWELSYVAY